MVQALCQLGHSCCLGVVQPRKSPSLLPLHTKHPSQSVPQQRTPMLRPSSLLAAHHYSCRRSTVRAAFAISPSILPSNQSSAGQALPLSGKACYCAPLANKSSPLMTVPLPALLSRMHSPNCNMPSYHMPLPLLGSSSCSSSATSSSLDPCAGSSSADSSSVHGVGALP